MVAFACVSGGSGNTAATAPDVWPVWVVNATFATTAATTTAGTGDTWPVWCSATNTTATNTATSTSTNAVWFIWTSSGGLQPAAVAAQVHVPTQEQLAAQEAVRAEAKRRQEGRKAAHDRAVKLLEEHLTPKQVETFRKNNWFVVEGGRSKKRYAICAGGSAAGNIRELNGDHREVAQLCCHIPYGVEDLPLPDHFLAQKLFLEHDEDEFLARANKTMVYGPRIYLEAA